MFKSNFGTKDQVVFGNKAEYYELIGYLASNKDNVKIVWEDNDEQGAWAAEGRIHFYKTPPGSLRAQLKYTAGRGAVVSRVNCNEFVEHIIKYHAFVSNQAQNFSKIRATIPSRYIGDFDGGANI